MEKKFKPGDVVQLKSGGPIMTVEDYEGGSTNERKVRCVWFDQKDLKRDAFAEPLIAIYERPRIRRVASSTYLSRS